MEKGVKWKAYCGLFMVTLATLMYEILLTRIFSVTMWYHFAFVAVSIAMFGMTIGALCVYLIPNYFTYSRTKYHLSLFSLFFAVSIVISFLTHLTIPFCYEKSFVASLVGFYSIALTYIVISFPFIFSGICVCLCLTRFPRQISKLYAADLAGAALGCILIVYILSFVDGPSAVFVVALLACLGAIFFSQEASNGKLCKIAVICSVLLFGFVIVNTVQARINFPLLRLMWVKGSFEPPAIFEKWNAFSRIRVSGEPNKLSRPQSWGFSSVYDYEAKARQLVIDIDASVTTVLTGYDGNPQSVEYLKYDIMNLVHYMRPNASVLVVGSGGGRDVLSALAFNQKSVVGVEINQNIIDVVNKRFGDFTGHLSDDRRVKFVNDEARSFVARSPSKFDIIQVSFIDTWAATASGAFVLAESSLYTVEAWKIFLQHLNTNGVLTFSRWFFKDRPGEIYRLTSLASASLKELGIVNPRDHILILKNMWWGNLKDMPDGVGTILVSRQAFSQKDLSIIEDVAKRLKFDIVLSPVYCADEKFAGIMSLADSDKFISDFPINISAPRDNNPFFFHMLRFKDVFNYKLWDQGMVSFNMKAISILGFLLIIVFGLTIICVIVPLVLSGKGAISGDVVPGFIYFGAIGLGFMFIEISQMQRLSVFLGHPTYGLSVVLFTLLLSSGIGSFLTSKIDDSIVFRKGLIRLLLNLFVLLIFGVVTPGAIVMFDSFTTLIRIIVAVVILFPAGLFMGMAFPLGMKITNRRFSFFSSWFWGINGATSVCASVLAVALSLNWGISFTFWSGFTAYFAALLAFIWIAKKKDL